MEFKPGNADVFGLAVWCAPEGLSRPLSLMTTLENYSLNPDFQGRTDQRSFCELNSNGSLILQAFVDSSVVEVFANSRLYLAKRIYPSRSDSVGIRLFVRDGQAKVRVMDIWQIA